MANFKVSKWLSQTRLPNAKTKIRCSGSQNTMGVGLFGWREHPAPTWWRQQPNVLPIVYGII